MTTREDYLQQLTEVAKTQVNKTYESLVIEIDEVANTVDIYSKSKTSITGSLKKILSSILI
jgi:hypothetical protein